MVRSQGTGAGVVINARTTEPLAPQVWTHAREARQQGLSLVLEISEPKKGAGRALERVWKRRHRIAAQLLKNIYLLRVAPRRFGFREVFRLTPYVAVGEPLLLAWSELGQTLSAPELRSLETEELLLERLAAFFDDVRAGRPRAQGRHPTARTAALERKFEELRRAARLLREGGGVPGGGGEPPPVGPFKGVSEQRGGFTHIREADSSAGQPNNAARRSEPGPTPKPTDDLTRSSAIQDIANSWQTWLAAARQDYTDWFAQHEMSADGTLESLAELDAFVEASPQNQQQACSHLASIAVYLADIVSEQRSTRWYADTSETQLLSSLKLELDDARDPQPIPLLERLFEVLQDPERSVFGLGVELCRLS